MSGPTCMQTLTARRTFPAVLVVCATPLLYEALLESFQGLATLHEIPAHSADLTGLLRALDADALVVDSLVEAEEIESLARERQIPLLQVFLPERKVRLLRDGGWEDIPDAGASAEAIRNLLVGDIFARRGGR